MSDELKACPFCGGDAERLDIEEGENAGGSCVSCTVCQASSNVEFGFKENFVSNWNRRVMPSPEEWLRESFERSVSSLLSSGTVMNNPAGRMKVEAALTKAFETLPSWRWQDHIKVSYEGNAATLWPVSLEGQRQLVHMHAQEGWPVRVMVYEAPSENELASAPGGLR